MQITEGQDAKGRHFRGDWTEIGNVVGAFCYMKAFFKNAKFVSEPTGLPGIGTNTVDIDVAGARFMRDTLLHHYMNPIAGMIRDDAMNAQHYLSQLRKTTLEMRNERNRVFALAEGSGKRVDFFLGAALGTMQIVRDTGFATVAVIGVPFGGGIAITAALVGAGGAAGAKYTDTGNLGAAVVAGTGALVMSGYGVIPGKLAGAAKGIAVGVGVVIDSAYELAGGVAEGKDLRQAGKGALFKAIAGGLGATLDHALVGRIDAVWSRLSRLSDTIGWKDAHMRLLLEGAKKGMEKTGSYLADPLGPEARGSPGLDWFVAQRVLAVR